MPPEEDLWNLAFSNICRIHGERRSSNDISKAILEISGIGPNARRAERKTGE
jgi:hypothetical protein